MKLFIVMLAIWALPVKANVLKFDCHNQFEDSAFGMTVILEGQTLKSYLFGTGVVGASPVVLERLTKNEASKDGSVSMIVSHLRLTPAQWAKVQSVEVYTSGNFDDDLAGVKGINLLGRDHKIVKKGMFFGWAGPQRCL